MGFTNLTDTQITGLTRAGATSAQRAAYEALTRIHGTDQENPSWCFRPVKEMARITGYRPNTCAIALRALCRLEFMDGITVLTRIDGGHRGRVTTYQDNLWQYSENVGGVPLPSLEDMPLASKGITQSDTFSEPKGITQSDTFSEPKGITQSDTFSDSERYHETTEKVSREAGKVSRNDRKGITQSDTQNRYTEQIPRTDRQRGSKSTEATKADPLVSGRTEDEWQMFVDWLLSRRTGSKRPAQAAQINKRAGGNRRERLDEWFAKLDEIARKYPTSDADLTPDEIATLDRAVRDWIGMDTNAYGIWALTSLNGYRECDWCTFED